MSTESKEMNLYFVNYMLTTTKLSAYVEAESFDNAADKVIQEEMETAPPDADKNSVNVTNVELIATPYAHHHDRIYKFIS